MNWKEPYDAAVQSIYALIHPAGIPSPLGHSPQAAERRLEMMRRLMDLLGNPQDRFRAVHVTGTSGKGSTATMIAEILRQAGLRVGLYSKPHVQIPLERIVIDGRPIHPAVFAGLVEQFNEAARTLEAREGYTPLYTQALVSLGLLAFARANVDVAVVEVGIGGRLDDTNVVHPLAAVITSVGYDHMNFLGPTLEHIAREKSGIIKEGAPAISGVTEPGPAAVIAQAAQAAGVPLTLLGRDFHYASLGIDLSGGLLNYRDAEGALPALQVGLLGEHQLANAAIAVAALRFAERRLERAIPLEAYQRGLQRAWLPGRLEIVQHEPLVLLDAAHNAQKAQALRAALDALVPGQPRVLVLGILAGKDSEEMIDVLAPGAQAVVVTNPPVIGNKHPQGLKRLARFARRFTPRVLAEPDSLRAVELALAETPADGLLCVTGSIYLVGGVRGRWFPEETLLARAAEEY
ncbi:MAG TPA: Mur ligase family protein [Ktedonobacterales bacterium]|nr:Mur ligase family protein [Ktedonobacterales bacterium]